MTRILLTILLLISTCAVVINGMLVYQFQNAGLVMTQEETSDDTPESTDGKETGKEKMAITEYRYHYHFSQRQLVATPYTASYSSTGFSRTPYNPPEVNTLFKR